MPKLIDSVSERLKVKSKKSEKKNENKREDKTSYSCSPWY